MCCTPSYHKDGTRYQIVGITEIPLGVVADNIEAIVQDIYKEYGIGIGTGSKSDNKNEKYGIGNEEYSELIRPDFKVYEGAHIIHS